MTNNFSAKYQYHKNEDEVQCPAGYQRVFVTEDSKNYLYLVSKGGLTKFKAHASAAFSDCASPKHLVGKFPHYEIADRP